MTNDEMTKEVQSTKVEEAKSGSRVSPVSKWFFLFAGLAGLGGFLQAPDWVQLLIGSAVLCFFGCVFIEES